MASEDRFGYEWRKYSKIVPNYEEMFLNWIGPLTRDDFNGKRVLDAGCGMGRNSYWPIKYGAKEVVAFDNDNLSVGSAKKNLSLYQNAKVFRRSIYDIDWVEEFDVVMSLGVIHHLKDPKRALIKLADSLKAGGKMVLWVYSYEGNEWIPLFIDPIRKNITSKLPIWLTHVISYVLSAPLWIYLKTVKNFKNPYFKQISKYDLWHIHSIVFDQLIPEIANYWKKEDLVDLTKDLPMDIKIYVPKNKMGWIVVGEK